jgi:hypothetical protein
MKTKLIVATLVSTFALIGAAQATPRGDTDNTPFQGTYNQQDTASASRTQVLQELHQARVNGLSNIGDSDNAPFLALADTGLSRAQVAAQVNGPTALGDSNNAPFEG